MHLRNTKNLIYIIHGRSETVQSNMKMVFAYETQDQAPVHTTFSRFDNASHSYSRFKQHYGKIQKPTAIGAKTSGFLKIDSIILFDPV